MMWAVADMPAFGDPNAPAQVHIAPEYIAGSRDDISVPNIVTSVLASYRGYDTLGEVAVIFTAGIGVTMLLMGRRPRRPRPEASQSQARRRAGRRLMKHHLVLRIVSKVLMPFIILFGLYVQFHGDFGPGGGFQAGHRGSGRNTVRASLRA